MEAGVSRNRSPANDKAPVTPSPPFSFSVTGHPVTGQGAYVESDRAQPTIAVYWIVRDVAESWRLSYESVIERCVPDQMVVLDTGSTDDTYVQVEASLKAWGKEHGRSYWHEQRKTRRHPKDDVWPDAPLFTFSECRNMAVTAVECDWYLQMDSDEFLTHIDWDGLKAELREAPETVECFSYVMRMVHDDGEVSEGFAAPRLLRKAVRYDGEMHNYPMVGASNHGLTDNIKVDHNRKWMPDSVRADRNTQRTEMAEKFFVERLEKDPLHRRSRMYLGMQYAADAKTDAAIEQFEAYMAHPEDPWHDERYQAAVYLARCYREKDRQEDALDICLRYMNDNPDRAELACIAGDIFRHIGERDRDVRAFKRALRWYAYAHDCNPAPVCPLFTEHAAHTWYPAIRAYELLANYSTGPLAEDDKRGWFKAAVARGVPTGDRLVDFQRIAVFTETGQTGFIRPLMEAWGRAGHEVRLFSPPQDDSDPWTLEKTLEWCDLAWFEWAGNLLAKATEAPKQCHIVTRIHGFECHTDMPRHVDWGKVDIVFATAHYLRLMLGEQCPDMEDKCRVYTVHGGIETHKFSVDETKKHGNKLCFAGYLNNKKQITLMMQVLHEALKRKPDLELHIAGTWQDSREYNHVRTLIAELDLGERVFFHDWQEDLNAFYADKDWFLNASMEESFCYALGEAMAAGCTPVVHCWKTARDLYPEESIWRTAVEAADIIARGPDPAAARDYAVKHLDVSRNIKRIMRVLAGPPVAVAGLTEEPWRMETKVAHALRGLGCRLVSAEQAQAVIAMRESEDLDRCNGAKLIAWHAETVDKRRKDLRERSESLLRLRKRADLYIHSLAKDGEFLGGAEVSFHPLGIERDIDVLYYGAVNERRAKMLQALEDAGVSVTCVQEYDHEALNRWLNRAKVVLNIHAHGDTPIPETRLAECLSAGTSVLSEPVPEWSPFASRVRALPFEAEAWAEALAEMLADDKGREKAASAARDWCWSHYRLDQNVERVLERVGL